MAFYNSNTDVLLSGRLPAFPKFAGETSQLTPSVGSRWGWSRVSMVTMLGPSPDWFVSVSGLSLLDKGEWLTQLTVDLPLYDAGTKSDITPVMGGPDIIPPDPIGLVAYDAATGVYLPAAEPQNVARLTFEKLPVAGK